MPFVVIEGPDGAGTTTQTRQVAERLTDVGAEVVTTAEPTDGPLGRVLRRHLRHEIDLDPHTAAMVFTGDRADHLDTVIRPALRRGNWVISDRYLLSTVAYQGAGGVSQEAIVAASANFEVPDLTVFLDVSPDAQRERLRGRDQQERYEDDDFGALLRDYYVSGLELLRRAGHRIELLDGTADITTVTDRIVELLPT